MSTNYELSPWNIEKDNNQTCFYSTPLKSANKSHYKSLNLPTIAHLSQSTLIKIANSNCSENKEKLVSLRSKRSFIANVHQKKCFQKEAVSTPSLQCNYVEYNTPLRGQRQQSEKIQQIKVEPQNKLSQLLRIYSNQKQTTMPLALANKKSEDNFLKKSKARSLSTLNKYRTYHMQKQKHKQNNKIQVLKFSSLEEIIRNLPPREPSSIGKKRQSFTTLSARQLIKILQPAHSPAKTKQKITIMPWFHKNKLLLKRT